MYAAAFSPWTCRRLIEVRRSISANVRRSTAGTMNTCVTPYPSSISARTCAPVTLAMGLLYGSEIARGVILHGFQRDGGGHGDPEGIPATHRRDVVLRRMR